MPTLNFADTKGTCHLAYDAEKGERYKFPDGVIWKVIDSVSSWGCGYKSILIQPESKDKNVTVLAFAGTDSVLDWKTDLDQALGEMPLQYILSVQVTVKHQKEYGSLFLTGHSLGGGLAAFSSVSTKIPANTINPAPLVGKIAKEDSNENSQITNYIAGDWEVVSSLPGRNPGKKVHVSGKGGCFDRHSLENVAPEFGFPKLVDGLLDIVEKVIEAVKQTK